MRFIKLLHASELLLGVEYMNFVNNMITNAVNGLHTSYLGKVLRVNGNRATVQPLAKFQEVGQEPKEQAVVSALILNNARYKINLTNITYLINTTGGTATKTVATAREIQAGDVVLCAVCERDISGQEKGQLTTPNSTMNYSLNNSVIVGIV